MTRASGWQQCDGTTSKRTRCRLGALGSDHGGVTPSGRTRCWQHLPWTEREALAAAREAAEEGALQKWLELEPACWSWTVIDEIREHLTRSQDPALSLLDSARAFMTGLRLYDQGRCAICGGMGNEVEDHCHWTGRVRGWLCRSCNVREAKDRHSESPFGKYRRRYPYMILDLDEPYTGRGWRDGEPIGGWWSGWGEPPVDPSSAEAWAQHPMRGLL